MLNVNLFLSMLFIISVVTSTLTEMVKKIFEGKEISYSSNRIALIFSTVICILTVSGYFILMRKPFPDDIPQFIFFIFILCVSSWMSAMLGYDKVIQLIKQIQDTKL